MVMLLSQLKTLINNNSKNLNKFQRISSTNKLENKNRVNRLKNSKKILNKTKRSSNYTKKSLR